MRLCSTIERAVSDAGIVLVATLVERLGIEALASRFVRLGERVGAANAGRKVMTLLFAMVLGADCIDDCELLRSGRPSALVGQGRRHLRRWEPFCARSPSGTSASSTDCSAEALTRAWRAGAGPGDQRLVVDVDSFVGELYGRAKQGAAFGYTRRRGYHPLLATRAETGEVLHIRLRTGSANTSRGIGRFLRRADRPRRPRRRDRHRSCCEPTRGSGQRRPLTRLEQAGWQFSIGVRLQPDRPRRDRADPRARLAHARRLPADQRSPRSPRPPSAGAG